MLNMRLYILAFYLFYFILLDSYFNNHCTYNSVFVYRGLDLLIITIFVISV